MKITFKIVSISFLLISGLFIYVKPSNVSAQMIVPDQEYTYTGSGTQPVPPALPVIDYSSNLSNSVYATGQTPILTSSATYNGCNNSARNIVMEGYIEGGEYHKVYDSTVVGGTSSMAVDQTFKDLPPGEYKMVTKVTAYSAEYYYVMTEKVYFSDFTLEGLITKAAVGNYTYNPATRKFFDNNNASLEYPLEFMDSGTQALAFYQKEIPFTVIGVTVYVNGKVGDTVSSGGVAEVYWKPAPASIGSCRCECTNEAGNLINCGAKTEEPKTSCGSGIKEIQPSSPPKITGITQKTIFKVTCSKP